jgi:hypothetical protein
MLHLGQQLDLGREECEGRLRERVSQGWTPGPERDDTARRTPYLVPYADLPEAIKEYDRAPVRDIPKLLAGIGFRVVRG